MRHHRRAFGISSLIAVVVALSLPASAQESAASGDPAEQLAKADALLGQENFSAAAEQYRLANEMADHRPRGMRGQYRGLEGSAGRLVGPGDGRDRHLGVPARNAVG
jgi:hypothetical protein